MLGQCAAVFLILPAAGPMQVAQSAERAPLRTAPGVVRPIAPQRVAPPAVRRDPQRGTFQVPQVSVLTPNARETVPMSGKAFVIQFGAKNMDVNKSLSYMPELVRNGTSLGPVFGTGFVLNKSKETDAVGVTPGHYISGYTGKVAPSGGGYQYRITVFEGTWGQGHKVVASGQSGIFSLGPAPVAAGSPQVSVLTPNSGETIPLSGGVIVVQFGAKNMDVNKSLSYMPELVRNGTSLGPVFGTGFVLNKSKETDAVGVTPGHYISGYAGQVAPPGGGYQYRITVFEGSWGQGHKVVASGQSGVFGLGPAPVAAGSPQVSVLTPKAGETIPLSGSVIVVQFGAKNMDVNKSLSYMPELVRNGTSLGPVFGTGFVLNKSKETDAVGVTPGHYISGYAGQVAPPGGGYQYRITVFEGSWGQGHKVVASGQSGIFSLGQ